MFFSAVSLEFDDRPGKVRDLIMASMKTWWNVGRHGARRAGRERNQAGRRPHQLAFEMHALASAANWSSRLFQDRTAFKTARTAVLQRLEQISTVN